MTTEITLDLKSMGQPVSQRSDAMLLVLLVFVGAAVPGIRLTEVPGVEGRWRVGLPERFAPADDARPIDMPWGSWHLREVKEAQR